MRVSIIGTGVQCLRRASVFHGSTEDILVSISGSDWSQTLNVSNELRCAADRSWESSVLREDVDAIIVCTPPNLHAKIAIAAMENGKHVLVEKPLARSIEESRQMVETSKATSMILKCGFNHRHHPAILEAKRRFESGALGQPLFARCRYGICGRNDYEHEWRADPIQAAGGQLIEQGTHAIDLIRWFMGEIKTVSAMTSTHYFKNQPMEDDGFAIFRTQSGGTASLHTSSVQWKNLFSFEVTGAEGYITVDGLGGTYGLETLSIGRRDFAAPFQDLVIQYRGSDASWRNEWQEFRNAVIGAYQPMGNGVDGLRAMEVALSAYQAEKESRVVEIVSSNL